MSQHKYAHQIDPQGGSAAARIARMIGSGQRVLELGCGPGTVTRILHAKGCKVTGVDMDSAALETCQSFCERVIQADLSQSRWLQVVQGETFDVVVMADVLEHLNCPQDLLAPLDKLLTKDGYVVLSVPNASHLSVLGCLMSGRFPYQSTGLLDRTHVRFFGRQDLDQLLLACGFLTQRWESVEVPPLASELSHFWEGLDAADRHFLQDRAVNGLVYQHVVKAYPSSQTGYMARLQADLADEGRRIATLMSTHQEALQQQALQQQALQQQALQQQALREQDALALKNADLERKLAAHLMETDALKRSRSWRITAPLRAVSRWLFHSL